MGLGITLHVAHSRDLPLCMRFLCLEYSFFHFCVCVSFCPVNHYSAVMSSEKPFLSFLAPILA